MPGVQNQVTVVFVCELRENLGFAAPLLCIANELARLAARHGCPLRSVFVIEDPIYGAHEIAANGHLVLPAPPLKRAVDIRSKAGSYANMLATIGFGDQRELEMSVAAWDGIFALLSPQLMVADNSPVACLAARGRIPVVVTGSAFAAPPIHMRAFPAIIGDARPETNQALLLDVVNRVLQSRGAPAVESLPGLFAAERRAIFAVPQLDPYHAVRNETLLNPCFDIRSPLTPPQTPSIFFSLPSTFVHLTMVVRALERAGVAIYGYVPGPRSVGLTLLAQARSRVFATWPNPSDALRDVSVVMSASADVAMAAYLAGRPQLILRGDVETSFIATELEKRRVAIALDAIDARTLTDAVRELLDDQGYTSSAQEEARRTHASLSSDGSAALVAGWCLELINGAGQDAVA